MISKQKIKEWLDLYLAHINEITPEVHVRDEEGYKFKSVDTFQKNFNIDAPGLVNMLDNAIESNNLSAGSYHFPRKMLQIFAEDYEEETRNILRNLFDSKRQIKERIDNTEKAFNTLVAKRNKEIGRDDHSFIGLRFISLLLGFRYPDDYNPIKPREWNVFCKFIDEDFKIPSGTLSGDRYEILSKYIEALRNHIKTVPEIDNLREQLTRGLSFKDKEFRWIAQDVIYVTARVLAKEKSAEKFQNEPGSLFTSAIPEERDGEIVDEQVGMEFPLEEYLESLIVKNWSSIDFGEPLELYVDEDDTIGQQYTTEVGIIDILAKDADGNFVVIELKKGRTNEKVVGQILKYIGWVSNNLATEGQKVRGIIIAADGSKGLILARSVVADKINIKYYRVKFDLIDPDDA